MIALLFCRKKVFYGLNYFSYNVTFINLMANKLNKKYFCRVTVNTLSSAGGFDIRVVIWLFFIQNSKCFFYMLKSRSFGFNNWQKNWSLASVFKFWLSKNVSHETLCPAYNRISENKGIIFWYVILYFYSQGVRTPCAYSERTDCAKLEKILKIESKVWKSMHSRQNGQGSESRRRIVKIVS